MIALLSSLVSLVSFFTPYTVSNSNWSGFTHTGYTWQVRGVVNVPIINCARSARSAAGTSWVGIDGAGNNAVEQTGVTYGCSNGRPWVDAWWENYPSGAAAMPLHVVQNDKVYLLVTYNGNHYFTYRVQDFTHPGSYSIRTYAPRSLERSGEWITERIAGVPFPSSTPIWWSGAASNGSVGIAASNYNYVIPHRSANYILGPGGAATIVLPG